MAGSQPVEVYDDGNMNINSVTMRVEKTILVNNGDEKLPKKGTNLRDKGEQIKNNALR